MTGTEKKARGRGRPNVLRKAYRLNLYVEAEFAANLRKLARYLRAKYGRPFSVSQTISKVVQGSREFQAMKGQRRGAQHGGGRNVAS